MPLSSRRHFDVLMVSDFRFPGGTSSSLATEIRAQAAAGYRTGLLQLPAQLLKTPRPFNDKIRDCIDQGVAELVLADEPVDAELLVIRHPALFSFPAPFRLDVQSRRRVMVVNQVPDDGSQPEPFYDIATCKHHAEAAFGGGFEWAPIGPLVRDALLPHDALISISEGDWYNVLQPDEWASSREAFVGDRPVIGRHSRPHWRKWPENPEDILAAYPDDPALRVRILGGAQVPGKILGQVPARWEVLPFDGVAASQFLRSIDFFVYFHHSGLVEAFGRAVIEAIASGAVAILPRSFERLFDDACLYGTPHDVRRLVWELYHDPARYRAQAARGMQYVADHFSWEAHARRVADRIGPPSEEAGAKPRLQSRPPTLLVAAPALGVPQLEELRGLVDRMPAEARVVLVTDSPDLPKARKLGLPLECAPAVPVSSGASPIRGALAAAVERAVRTHRPDLVLVQEATRQQSVLAVLDQERQIWAGLPQAEEDLRQLLEARASGAAPVKLP